MITCIELNVPSILCMLCSLRKVDAKCMWSCKWTDTLECLRWERDGGCWYPNIDSKGNSMLFRVAHIKFLRCSTRARTLNWTSLPPAVGCVLLIATA